MSNTRQEQRLGLKAKTWNKLDTYLEKTQDEQIIHCHIPLCIGFKESISGKELVAILRDVVEKKYDYTVYLSPKDDGSLAKWKQDNSAQLTLIPDDKIINVNSWRKGNAWMQAEAAYDVFSKGEKSETAERMLALDVDNFSKRNKEIAQDEIRQHVKNELVDVLSWMNFASNDLPQDKVNLLNVLMYSHNLTQSMRNVVQNAAEMGYVENSIQHIKYDFEMVSARKTSLPKQRVYSAPSGTSPTGSNSDQPIDINSVMLTILSNKDPKYLANFVASYQQILSSQSAHNGYGHMYTVQLPVAPDSQLVAVDVLRSSGEVSLKPHPCPVKSSSVASNPASFFNAATSATQPINIPSPSMGSRKHH